MTPAAGESEDLEGATGQGYAGQEALAGSCTPIPERVRKHQADPQTEGVEEVASMPVLLSRLSSCPLSRLPRPGRPAPLRAFGPGSRSCDVISKARALSSDTQPCPAGPGSQALFTELGRGEGRRNGPGLLRARQPWQPPAWPLRPPPPLSLHVQPGPRCHLRDSSPKPLSLVRGALCQPARPGGRLQYSCILQFPRPGQNRGSR